jgi:hypothetical protein
MVAPESCTVADSIAHVPLTALYPCITLLDGETTSPTCGAK